jgi:hypothetical protein
MSRRVVFLACFLAPASAAAQWSEVSQASAYGLSASEGPGFRLGEQPLTLHPGISVETGYDSNVFYLPDSVGAGLMRIRGHFDLATLAQEVQQGEASTADPALAFRLSTQMEYREYLTDNPAAQAQRSFSLFAIGNVTLFPRGPFTLALTDLFARTVDPRNSETTAQFERDTNRVSLLAGYRLSAIEFGLGDYFEVNYWENSDLKFANSIIDEAQAFGRLQFLPQSTASLTVRAGYIEYTNDPALQATPIRALAGITTMTTRNFGWAASVGVGASLHKTGPSYTNVIGSAEVFAVLPEEARAALGYERDFHDSLFANFFVDDHVFVSYERPLLRLLSARAGAGVRFRHYEGLIDPSIVGATGYSSAQRDDRIYEFHGDLDYRLKAWLAGGLTYNLMADDTDFRFLEQTMSTPVHYVKHSVFVRADFSY